MIPVVPAPSRRTRELKERLEQAIRDYSRDHPNLSPAEIQHALQILSAGESRGDNRRAVSVIAMLVAAFLGLGVALFARQSPAGDGGSAASWVPTAIVAVIVLLVAAIAIVRRQNRD